MPETFHGNYFDGQSAKPQRVLVSVEYRKLLLTAADSIIPRQILRDDIKQTELAGSDRMLIRFGKDGMEMLDIRSEQFVKTFRKEFPTIKSHANFLERFAHTGWKGITALVVMLVAAVLLIYFLVIPGVGDFAARFFPREYEEQLGETMYGNIIKQYDVDSAKTKLLNELVEHVDFETKYKLKIVVVDYDEKNAFAMPGGYIIVYSGILEDMDDYPELVGLLAHEVSHVNKRHTLRSLFRSLSSYIFISVLLNDVNGLTTVVLENLNSIKTLSFSRKLEREADIEGLHIMFQNKVDPNGMVELFENLMKDGDLPSQMEFLSTHPVTKKRIDYIEEKIEESDCTVETDNEMESIWLQLKAVDSK